MIRVKDIVKELKIFERNKVPLEVKVLGIATYIQTSSVRRTARILSEIHPVSKTSVWNWIKKFEEKLPCREKKRKKCNSNRKLLLNQKALLRLFM